jgi:hypothetical protein
VPALLAMLAAALIFGVAGLHDLHLLPGDGPLGASWTILAGFLLTLGHFSGLMAVATHFYGVRSGYRRLRPGFDRWSAILTLEHTLMASLALILLAGLWLGEIGIRWQGGGFLALPSVLPLVMALSIGSVGVQTALGGFLISILAGHDASFVPEAR